jgi:hypothetical protein
VRELRFTPLQLLTLPSNIVFTFSSVSQLGGSTRLGFSHFKLGKVELMCMEYLASTAIMCLIDVDSA